MVPLAQHNCRASQMLIALGADIARVAMVPSNLTKSTKQTGSN